MDRDWYWQRRARRNSPDDDHLFPNHRWPGRRSMVYPTVLAVLAILALLVWGLHQGWFDRNGRSRAAMLEAETEALRPWSSGQVPAIRPPNVGASRAAPRVDTFYDKHRLSIDFGLLGMTILAPLVLLGLLVGMFIRRLRGPALIGLLFGFVAASASAPLYTSGSLFAWGLLRPADSMGGAFQFFMVVIATFGIAAIVSAAATFVFGVSGQKEPHGTRRGTSLDSTSRPNP